MSTDNNKNIRIGCASAFWGDTSTAAEQLVTKGHLDYLVFDYLAEVTMSIMAGARLRNPEAGYAPDFVQVLTPLLPKLASDDIKVISNAGGINPHACKEALNKAINDAGLSLKVAVVSGDDILDQQQALKDAGQTEMFSGETAPERFLSLNAYLGYEGIKAALDAGADIVITGRIVDSAVVTGALAHEFNWSPTAYDLLAQASLAGHVIECGTQCTGGNFTDWQDVTGFEDMGFPIIECQSDGSFTVSKPEGTGGLVSTGTVSEQILYEIGDPQHYILPDVVCDFSQVSLEEVSDNRVKVSGAKGRKPTCQYKVSGTYTDGFRCTTALLIGGLNAGDKARATASGIIEKCRLIFERHGFADFSDIRIDVIGDQALSAQSTSTPAVTEAVLRIAVAHQDKKALVLFTREIAQAATAMTPGITGTIAGGRPGVSPCVKLFSLLVPKQNITVSFELENSQQPVEIHSASLQHTEESKLESWPVERATIDRNWPKLPLYKLAWARSGDKGNHCNIGVIARRDSYIPYLAAALTESVISKRFQHHLDSDNSRVSRWYLPGLNAFNFLLENSLGGGGMSSLNPDPQGKAYAQQILDLPIAVPPVLAQSLMNTNNK